MIVTVFEISGCTGARCTQTFSLCTQVFDLGARRAPKKNDVVHIFYINHDRRTCVFSCLSNTWIKYSLAGIIYYIIQPVYLSSGAYTPQWRRGNDRAPKCSAVHPRFWSGCTLCTWFFPLISNTEVACHVYLKNHQRNIEKLKKKIGKMAHLTVKKWNFQTKIKSLQFFYDTKFSQPKYHNPRWKIVTGSLEQKKLLV